ncbi:MAG: rhomboid family intramembrane serine protease [Bacilli bacterium]|nr:rhomboid family intramembrane serine protease [Bacilli bacterium]MDD3305018.1 rhomboid family intramembrane serine protease [Bacilli bacterium]MDD4053651.1 rhomboid family intramembrane serine protease [Bacilli bacterium]MDD4411150.1 rhomboid family intramembrane serine protease [Bacilli bacterium]
MENVVIRDKDAITMKLLHFFITDQGYTPIIVHGVKDEIWLENMQGPYPIVRIMSGHIHNREQLEFDMYKTHSLVSRIKKKTFRFKIKTLAIFLDIEDNVKLEANDEIDCVNVINEDKKENYEVIEKAFPGISSKLEYNADGLDLFVKITEEINATTERETKKIEDVFKFKKPYITYGIICLNVLVFFFSMLYGIDTVATYLGLQPDLVRSGQIYRLLTAVFVHASVLHILLNMYALYIIGPQLESFYGSGKFLIIYLFSALMGSLLSMSFLGNGWSVGASGAIFGLFGSLLYFGYHYRVYLGDALKSQIIPIILLNLFLGFAISGIDQFAHLGGLIGGVIISVAVGLKYKTSKSEQINGIVLSLMALVFLIYIAFIYTASM